MTNNDPHSRDRWSKLEIIAKLVGDVVLVALTLVIANGTHKISTVLQTGELTQHLLSDLASADSTSALRLVNRDLSTSKYQVPGRHIEVWLNIN